MVITQPAARLNFHFINFRPLFGLSSSLHLALGERAQQSFCIRLALGLDCLDRARKRERALAREKKFFAFNELERVRFLCFSSALEASGLSTALTSTRFRCGGAIKVPKTTIAPNSSRAGFVFSIKTNGVETNQKIELLQWIESEPRAKQSWTRWQTAKTSASAANSLKGKQRQRNAGPKSN